MKLVTQTLARVVLIGLEHGFLKMQDYSIYLLVQLKLQHINVMLQPVQAKVLQQVLVLQMVVLKKLNLLQHNRVALELQLLLETITKHIRTVWVGRFGVPALVVLTTAIKWTLRESVPPELLVIIAKPISILLQFLQLMPQHITKIDLHTSVYLDGTEQAKYRYN